MKTVKVLAIAMIALFSYQAVNAQVVHRKSHRWHHKHWHRKHWHK